MIRILKSVCYIFQLASIADRTISEADKSGDGTITFEEFCQVGHHNSPDSNFVPAEVSCRNMA